MVIGIVVSVELLEFFGQHHVALNEVQKCPSIALNRVICFPELCRTQSSRVAPSKVRDRLRTKVVLVMLKSCRELPSVVIFDRDPIVIGKDCQA